MWSKIFNAFSRDLELSMDKEMKQRLKCRAEDKKILSDTYYVNKSIKNYPSNSEIDKHRLTIIKLFIEQKISFALTYPFKTLDDYSCNFFDKYNPDKVPNFSLDECDLDNIDYWNINELKCFFYNPYKELKEIHKLACEALYLFKLFDISETASNTDYGQMGTRYYQKAIDELTKLTKKVNKAKGRIKGARESKLIGKELDIINFMINEFNSGVPFSRTDTCKNTIIEKTAKKFNCSTRAILGLCGKKDLTEYKKLNANNISEADFTQIISLSSHNGKIICSKLSITFPDIWLISSPKSMG